MQSILSSGRVPDKGQLLHVTVAVMGLLFSAGLAAASTVTVPVRVTFVDPIAISDVKALQFGSLDRNLSNLEGVTVAPDSVVTDPTDAVEGGTQAAASLTVTTSPGRVIMIHVDGVIPGTGYSLTDFRCSYNAGTVAACDGEGHSVTSVASGRLLIGATLISDDTAVIGAADGSLEVTITYQ